MTRNFTSALSNYTYYSETWAMETKYGLYTETITLRHLEKTYRFKYVQGAFALCFFTNLSLRINTQYIQKHLK